ncbi:hypothetical protein TW83_13970 [Paracoccus sp. S4493]|nr:hypothetical protein TW83_13970 [Paracoccus sp. S4493]
MLSFQLAIMSVLCPIVPSKLPVETTVIEQTCIVGTATRVEFDKGRVRPATLPQCVTGGSRTGVRIRLVTELRLMKVSSQRFVRLYPCSPTARLLDARHLTHG